MKRYERRCSVLFGHGSSQKRHSSSQPRPSSSPPHIRDWHRIPHPFPPPPFPPKPWHRPPRTVRLHRTRRRCCTCPRSPRTARGHRTCSGRHRALAHRLPRRKRRCCSPPRRPRNSRRTYKVLQNLARPRRTYCVGYTRPRHRRTHRHQPQPTSRDLA